MSSSPTTPPRPPPTAVSRRSYFREAPMDLEYTPANSIHEDQLFDEEAANAGIEQSRRRGAARRSSGSSSWCNSMFWSEGTGKLILRMSNALGHLALCALLLIIMIEFLLRYTGHKRLPQAIVLITFSGLDAALDIYALMRPSKKWQGATLLLRLLLSLGYIAQFFLYVGFRHVFPKDYAYWGMRAGFSEPVVYILLWVTGLWNLLHTTIHRHTLGRDLRRYFTRNPPNQQRQQSNNSRAQQSQRRSRHSTIRWETGAPQNVQRGPSAFEIPMPLGEVRMGDANKGTRIVVTHRNMSTSASCSSLESGESSSKPSTMVRVESKTESVATSRRASSAGSEQTLEAVEDTAAQDNDQKARLGA